MRSYREFPVIEPGTRSSVTEKISNVVLRGRHPLQWYVMFFFAFLLLNGLMVSIGWLLFKGIGIWGNNQPVGWAFDIINFVWWIGIGHAGTLISAILLLLKQDWRTSINRFAEAMTLFAVACALIFPLIHTGRPWLAAYWLLPYPNTMDIWPQFRSPLIWDVFAVSTYGTVSAALLVHGAGPGSRDDARPGEEQASRAPLRHRSRSAGGDRRGTGSAMKPRTCCWPACRRRWCCRCTRW